VYSNLASELPKEILNVVASTSLSSQDKSSLILVMDALTKLCNIRRDMINLYQAILAQSVKGEFDLILEEMEALQQRTSELDLQKDLCVLGLGVEREINILTCLLRARTAITRYAFQDTCIALYQTRQDLLDWKRICQEQDYPEVKKITSNNLVGRFCTNFKITCRNLLLDPMNPKKRQLGGFLYLGNQK
jgi:hypothetical protein